MTRRKKQIKKSTLIIIILTILISIGLYFLLFSKSTGVLLVKSKDKTAKFDYTLDKDNTNLMKENFKELKDILANDNINYEDYAKTLAKLFIIDLYTIDNKKSMYDVGSLEYVYDKENFKTRCQNTLYKGLNDKSTRKNNEYPIVESINIDSFENGEFNYNDNKYESYEITLSWDYKKDLGYDKKGKVTIIKIEDKLYVVSYEGGEKWNF